MGWTVARWLTNTAYQMKTSFSEHYFEMNLLSHNHILDYDRPWMYKIIHVHVQYICFKPTSDHQEDNKKNSRYHTPRQTPTSSPSLSISIWNATPPHMPSWAVLRTGWAPSSYFPPHCPPQKTHPTTIRFVSPHFSQPVILTHPCGCFVQTAPQTKKGKKYSVINLWASALCIRATIIPPRLTDPQQFYYWTDTNLGTGADDTFVLKRGVWRNATWPSHSRLAIAACPRHFRICFLP